MDIDILITRLNDKFDQVLIGQNHTDLRGIKLFEPDFTPEDDVLFIGKAHEICLSSDRIPANLLIIGGKITTQALIKNLMFWKEDVSVVKVINTLQDEFLAFERFQFQICSAKTIPMLLDYTDEYLKDSVVFFRKDGIIQHSLKRKTEYTRSQEESLVKKIYEYLKEHALLSSFNRQTTIVLDNVSFLVLRVTYQMKYYGYLVFFNEKKDYRSIYECVLESLIKIIVGKNKKQTGFPNDSFDIFFTEYLGGIQKNEREITNALQLVGWNEPDFYFLYEILFPSCSDTAALCSELYDEINCRIPNSKCVFLNGKLYLLINRTASGMIFIRNIRDWLMPFIQKNNLNVGIASGILGFSNIISYVDQCDYALIFGMRLDPDLHYYQYSKYLFYRIIDSVSQFCNIYEFVHPAIRLLNTCDKEHGTEYVNTLLSYVTCDRIATKTAQELGIHRNTLNYRLERVREITKVEFESEETTFYAKLSCSIIKYIDKIGNAR